MYTDGRKIPASMENPLDNILIYIATYINYRIHAPLGIHPNIITVASIVAGLSAAYFLYRSCFLVAGFLYFVAYFLDCVDGNLARMSNTVSDFGDALDHIGDMVKIGTLSIVYLRHTYIPIILRIIFGIGSVALFLLAMIHLACQESEIARKSPFLTIAKCVAPIRLSRWFGSGTFIMFQTFMILILILVESSNNGCVHSKQICESRN